MAADWDLVLAADRAIVGDQERTVRLGIKDGRIATLDADGTPDVILAGDEVLLPGLVDTHVHVNEPGRTDWEGYASATRAAAAGGVTTLLDMPLNSIPPTTTVANLRTKQAAARDQVWIDTGFWGGAVPANTNPGNAGDLAGLHEAGVFGFKCFLLPSGVDEFPPLGLDEIETDMRELVGFDSLLIVHAEDAHEIEAAPDPHGPHYSDFLASRPHEAEDVGIAEVIERAERTGARAHILHLSSAEALDEIREARDRGVRLTVETCPHYLTLTAESVPDGATAFKCCPPIREEGNRDRLWQGLLDGTIDCIVSDHSPATVDLKQPADGDFGTAWGGISSLQLGLSLVWTEAARRGIPLQQVVEWMSASPARVAGLQRKGRLEVGYDADFAVFAPEEAFTVELGRLRHKNPVSAYEGKTLTGVVRTAYLRGEEIDGETPRGRLLRRGEA